MLRGSVKAVTAVVGVPCFALAYRERRRVIPHDAIESVDSVLSSPLHCTKTRLFHSIRPFIFLLDPETAHSASIFSAQLIAPLYLVWQKLKKLTHSSLEKTADLVFGPSSLHQPNPSSGGRLSNKVCDIQFSAPCGVAAGFDKNGKLINFFQSNVIPLGHAEIGSVSYGPWEGNPRPRLFRLVPDQAIINRMGLNNDGARAVASRLSSRDSRCSDVQIGINITKTPDPKIEGNDAVTDIASSFEFMQFIDSVRWITLNISCPNTAEGKTFEDIHALSDLLSAICSKKSGKKIFLKLSPGNNLDDKKFIIDVAKKFHVDALVIANTVPDRNFDLKSDSPIIQQKGGLSGPPILERSIPLIRMGYKSGLPVIGVGGVSSGKDAYRLIRNGASLIQLYTAMVYHGPFVFEDIHRGLERCLLIDGFRNVSEIIGIDAD